VRGRASRAVASKARRLSPGVDSAHRAAFSPALQHSEISISGTSKPAGITSRSPLGTRTLMAWLIG